MELPIILRLYKGKLQLKLLLGFVNQFIKVKHTSPV